MMYALSIAGLVSAFPVEAAHAQVTEVLTGLTVGGGGGAASAIGIANTLQNAGRSLIVILSVFMLVRAAAKMIGSASEEKMEEGRRSVGSTIIGIILVSLTYAFVSAFWNGGSKDVEAGAAIVNLQVMGLIRWARVFMGILAVGMIIISAFKVLASFGKEDAGEEVRRPIIGALVGIFLIVFDTVIIDAIGGGTAGTSATPEPLILVVMNAIRNLLMYLGLLAVIMIAYAGIMMIVTVGDDDQYGKSKSLIVRVLIGLAIILFSYLAVSVITAFLFP